MRVKALADSLGLILLLFSLAFIAPLATGLSYGEEGAGTLLFAYGVPMAITMAAGIILRVYGWGSISGIRDREAFAAAGIGWLLLSLLGALPYLMGSYISSPVDALFESTSGITTTGATILEAPGGDYTQYYPHSILMWRATTQWVGGMGILVLAVVVLSRVLEGGLNLFRTEVPDQAVSNLRPRLAKTARTLWVIYGALTGLQVLLLWVAFTGLGNADALFEAVCLSFATVSTGGFAPHAGAAAFGGSTVIAGIVLVFMFLAGVNFILYYQFTKGNARSIIADPEFRLYALICALATAFVAFTLLVRGVYGPGGALGHGLFAVVSVQSTTGFAMVDYGMWPHATLLVFLVLMFIGGCIGSTAGGLKVVRFLILMKLVRREVSRAVHPHGVFTVSLGGVRVPDMAIRVMTIFFFSFILLVGISTAFLCFLGLDLVTSLSATCACLFNVGPGLGAVGPYGSYALIHPAAKVWLSAMMWVGRLELFVVLMLLFPTTWRD